MEKITKNLQVSIRMNRNRVGRRMESGSPLSLLMKPMALSSLYWVETGKVARITQLERGPGGISWSPDGNYIAFTMKIEEKNPVLVSAPKKPEGAKWAATPRVTDRFKYEQDGAGYLDPGFTHIFMVNAGGGAVRQLSSGDFNHGAPVWAPDGETIYFQPIDTPIGSECAVILKCIPLM